MIENYLKIENRKLKINKDLLQVGTSLFLSFLLSFLPVLPSLSLSDFRFLGALTSDAAPITWTGAGEDSLWSNPANWSENKVPGEFDVAFFDSTSTADATINSEVKVAGILIERGYTGTIKSISPALITVGLESFIQKDGTFEAHGSPMAVRGSTEIQAGRFLAPSSSLNIAGSLLVSSHEFYHNGGTVELSGIEQVVIGSTSFHHFIKKAQVSQQLTFQSGSIITVEGNLTLTGTKLGGPLKIRSSNPGQPFTINPRGPVTVKDLNLADIINASLQPIDCDTCAIKENVTGFAPLPGQEEGAPAEAGAGEVQNADEPSSPTLPPIQEEGSLEPTIGGIIDTAKDLLPLPEGEQEGQSPEPSVAPEPSAPTVVSTKNSISGTLEAKPGPDFDAASPVQFVIEVNSTTEEVVLTPVTVDEESVEEANSEEADATPTPSPTSTPEATPKPFETPDQPLSHWDFIGHWSLGIGHFLIPTALAATDDVEEEIEDEQPINPTDTEAAPPESVVSTIILDPIGQPTSLTPTIGQVDGQTVLTIPEPDGPFRPGKYTLEVKVGDVTISQDFTWGVLAANFSQSTYQVGEEIDLGLGVLSDSGHTICNAELVIDIEGPTTDNLDNDHWALVIGDGISRSPTCGPITITNNPDYLAKFIPKQAGEYHFQITAHTINGSRRMVKKIAVTDSSPYLTKRTTATRIYPPADYTVSIEITAHQDFTGTITEPVPADFGISNISNNGELSDSRISWPDISLTAGQSITLNYTYDAPDISPQFYLLGPLEAGEWSEPRSWQIAADATFNDAATGNWNDGATWGNSSPGTEGTDYPGASDTATIDSHTVTLVANQSVDDLTLATGGTLVGNDNILDVNGTWNNTGGTFTEDTSTIHFTGASDETITTNSDDFHNVVINDGLVGYWKLDDATGTSVAHDSSGYNLNGTLTDMDTSTDWLATAAPTNFSSEYSLDFDGTDDYISIGNTNQSTIQSISFWMYADDVTSRKIISFDGTDQIEIDGSSNITATDFPGDATVYVNGSVTSSVTASAWHHIAVTDTTGVNGSTFEIGRVSSGFDVSTSSHVDEYDVSGQTSIPAGIAFSNDGTKMFVVGNADDEINEYTLTTGFDVSTASFVDALDVSSEEPSPRGLTFNTDGTIMYVVGSSGDEVNEYSLSAAFDVSSASAVDTFDLSSEETSPRDIAFNTDGTKMFVTGANGDDVNEYTLSSAFDASTASFVDAFSVLASPRGVAFNTDGTKMFISGNDGEAIGEYTLSTGFDVSTASFVDSFSTSTQETSPQGVAFNTDGTKMFVVGNNGDDVTEYTMGSSGYFDGRLDDVRIYDHELTAQEVASLAAGSAPATDAGGRISLADALDVDGSLFLNSGELDTTGSNWAITVEGTWENNGGLLNGRSGTVTLDGTSSGSELQPGGQQFNNLTISGSGGEWLLTEDLDVDGTYAQSNGTLDQNTAPGLVGHWKLDEGIDDSCSGGEDVCDTSTHNNHGTWNGSGAGNNTVATWSDSTSDQINFHNPASMNFDGTDDYINGGTPASVNWGAGDGTVSVWIKTSANYGTSYGVVVINGAGGTSQKRYVLHVDGDDGTPTNRPRFDIDDDGGALKSAAGPSSVNDGLWHHLVGMRDGDNLRLFVDGVEVATTDITGYGNIDDTEGLTFGATNNGEGGRGDDQFFNGEIDDIRIFNRALSPQEVSILASGHTPNSYSISAADFDKTGGTLTTYQERLTIDGTSNQTIESNSALGDLHIEDPTEANLVGYWKFDEGQGTTATDSSSNTNTGTLTNAPKWSTTVTNTISYDNPFSLEFDGTDDYIDAGADSSLDLAGTSYTVSAWIYPNALEYGRIIANNQGGTSTGYSFNLDSAGVTGSLAFYDKTSGTENIEQETTTALTANTWQHVAAVVSSGSLTLYVNGVSQPLQSSGIDLSGAAGVSIGRRQDGLTSPNTYFDGHIDDLRIYSTALSATQVGNLTDGHYADGDNSTASFTLGAALDVDGDVHLQSGVLDASATPYNITAAGDWNNYGGTSSFNDQTGTVTFDAGGGITQSIRGDTTFYNLTKTEAGDDSTDETIAFESSSTQTIANTLTLDGRDDNDRINIKSTIDTVRHTLDLTGGKQGSDFLDVRDSQVSTNDNICRHCLNTSNNDNAEAPAHWVFRIRTIFISLPPRSVDNASLPPGTVMLQS